MTVAVDTIADTTADTTRPIEHIVDAHVHIWDPARVTYPWLAEVPRLNRRFMVDDVEAELSGIGVSEVVLVQAADSIDDTRHMIETARTNRRVSGVVAWVPIDETKEWTPWATRLAAAAQAPNVVAKLSGLNTAAARHATAADDAVPTPEPSMTSPGRRRAGDRR